jgi:hypothetical protein
MLVEDPVFGGNVMRIFFVLSSIKDLESSIGSLQTMGWLLTPPTRRFEAELR